ncbi:hypothetical protein CPB86DRAFT_210984 [Serendipita vermifera]|nr:hypothetical protein CPB86DRAFT_210984 [Serendipita vermifera]
MERRPDGDENDPTEVPLTFNVVVSDLSHSIENAMSELFKLERASINAYGDNIADSEDLRRALQEHWNGISEMLKAAHLIGDDVNLLRSRLTMANKRELQTLLEDLETQITDVNDLTSKLIPPNPSERPTTPYDTLWQGKKAKGRINHSEGDAEWNPDGLAAGKRYRKAIRNITRCLQELEMIWKEQIEFCTRCINGLRDEKNTADNTVEALEFSNDWVGYQKDIVEAKLLIGKVCDAIPIKATGSPLHTSSGYQREMGHGDHDDYRRFRCPLDPATAVTAMMGWLGGGVVGILDGAKQGVRRLDAGIDHEETEILDVDVPYSANSASGANHDVPHQGGTYHSKSPLYGQAKPSDPLINPNIKKGYESFGYNS